MNTWIPRLETERLLLRELVESDVTFIFEHFSNEDVCKYLLDEEPFKKIEEAKELITLYSDSANKIYNRWGIELKETGELIGTCGFHLMDKTNKIIEIGYDLQKQYWHQGYGREALNEALNVVFNHMGLNRVQAFIYVENIASYKLLEKMNFKREGIIRDKHLFKGQYYDHYCYSLLKREFEYNK